MLGIFILLVFLGFPIAFTLMALGIFFGYFAYFDPNRMWRSFNRLEGRRRQLDLHTPWIDGFFNKPHLPIFSSTRPIR